MIIPAFCYPAFVRSHFIVSLRNFVHLIWLCGLVLGGLATTGWAEEGGEKRIFDSYGVFCEELMVAGEVASKDEDSDESWVRNALVPGEWVIRFIEETKEMHEPPAIRIADSIVLGGLDFSRLKIFASKEKIEKIEENEKEIRVVENKLEFFRCAFDPEGASDGFAISSTRRKVSFFKQASLFVGKERFIIFKRGIEFEGVYFYSAIDLSFVSFGSTVSFVGCYFFEGVDFFRAYFSEQARFNGSKFFASADFGFVRFDQFVDFDRAYFLGKTSFFFARFDSYSFNCSQFNFEPNELYMKNFNPGWIYFYPSNYPCEIVLEVMTSSSNDETWTLDQQPLVIDSLD
jgi:hypothetical protein